MRFNIISKILSLILCLALISSCTLPSSKSSKQFKSSYDDFIVVDVFNALANFQGIQSGWFAHVVKEKFNMELNMIAPNVAGGGDLLFQTRTASGNLGDLIIASGENGRFAHLVQAGLLMDMEPYLKGQEIMRFEQAIALLNDPVSESSIYGIPSEISSLPPDTSSEATDLTYGPYLRWDLYEQLDHPPMATLEDLLPVLSRMQALYPETEDGTKTYGFSFFKDWDGNLMNAAKQPTCFYGYDEFGFVLAKADGSDYQDILGDASQYLRVLKLFFDANQMGLVDPESRTQNIEAVHNKFANGSILFSPWPWLAQPAFNTLENTHQGKGYMFAPIDDLTIYAYGNNPEGNQKTFMAIGSNAKDPERLADFINWLYSPEGIMISGAYATYGTGGIQGLTYELDSDGLPYLTDFGIQALVDGDASVPERWGSGAFRDGVSTLNYKPVSQSDLSPDGYPYHFSLWESFRVHKETALDQNWQTFMNATSTKEYLTRKNQILVAPGTSYISPEETTEITTIRSQCRALIVDYSWQMIFADDEVAFEFLLDNLRQRLQAYGYHQVLQEDLRNARLQHEARIASLESYQMSKP